MVGAVLDEVAPARSGDLWKALVASKPLSSAEESDQQDVDVVLMQALGECYANANTWENSSANTVDCSGQIYLSYTEKVVPGVDKVAFHCCARTRPASRKRHPSSKNNPNVNVCNPEAS